MAHGPAEPPPPGRARRWWYLSTITASVSFVLSYIGFRLGLHDVDGWTKFGEALYESAELVLLHMPQKFLPPHAEYGLSRGLIDIARPLAVIAVGATGVALVMQFFGRELRRAWTARLGHHTVICGLSRTGQQLIDEFRHAREKVLAIDEGSDHAAVVNTAESGASLLLGNGADPQVLRRAGFHRAKFLFAALDDDATNVRIAVRAIEAAQEPFSHRREPLQMFVHIADPQLHTVLRHHHAFRTDGRKLRVNLFNVFENSARLLLRDYPLDYVRITEQDARIVQMVVVGFGRMGEAVLTRAAMVAHYANLKRLRAIVIDRQAHRQEGLFRARYPRFGEVCDAEFHELDGEEPSTHARIAKWCADKQKTISTVVITLDHDARALSLALSLLTHLDPMVPIRVRLSEQAGLAGLLGGNEAGGTLPGQITPFGSMHDACTYENWARGAPDTMAKAVHEDYVRRQHERHQASADDRNMRAWEQLDEDLIDSNRQLADHIPVKVRALGYHIAPCGSHDLGKPIKEFTKDEIELLGKMEHRRWMAERFLAGWVYGDRDYEKRRSPYLVEWEDLPQEIQEYDRNFARIIPGVLARVEREIHQ